MEQNKPIYSYLNELSKRSQLKDAAEGARRALLAFWRFPKSNTRMLAEMTGLPVPGLSALRSELVKAEILSNKITLSEEGKEFCIKELGFANTFNIPLHYQQTPSLEEQKFFSPEFIHEIEKMAKKRPHPNSELDQMRANVSTLIRRIRLLLEYGDLEGRRITCLGDDDGQAVILEAFRKYHPEFKFSIRVIDIDSRILSYIEKWSLNSVTFLQHDLKKPLPREWQNNTDIILTDPPYTIAGASLFLRRSTEVLERFIGNNHEEEIPFKTVYLSFSQKDLLFTTELIQMLIKEHFTIQDIIQRFNYYTGERLVHYYGNIWILKNLPLNFKAYEAKLVDEGKIYTWQMIPNGIPRSIRKKI